MVYLDIPLLSSSEKFIADGISSDYILTNNNAVDVSVYVSGLLMTIDEDYTYSNGTVSFIEIPLLDENINIKYSY